MVEKYHTVGLSILAVKRMVLVQQLSVIRSIMDDKSTSDTIPYNEILNDNISLEHEAKVSKVSEEQLFYLMSRGISEQEATEMIVMGFIEPFTKELPMEYAVEMNRLIKFEMEGSIG